MIRAGALKYTINFERRLTLKDEYGAESVQYVPKFSVKGDIKYKSGTKTTENNAVFNSQSIEITLRFRSDIDETDRILIGSTYYNILFVNPTAQKDIILSVEKLQDQANIAENPWSMDGGDLDSADYDINTIFDGGEL